MVITEKTAGQAVRKSMGNCSGGCAQSAVPDLEDSKLVAGIEAGVKDTRRVQTEVGSTGLRDALLAESAGFCAPSSAPSGQVPSTRSLSPPRPQHGRCACHGKSARRDKTKVDQAEGLSGTKEVEHSRYAVPEFDGFKLGNDVKAEAHDVRCDHAVQSAVSMCDGPKLRNEVEAEAQSADRMGTVEIERRRYAAGQAAGRQVRPASPIRTATVLDADLAAKMAEKAENTTHLTNAVRDEQKENITYFWSAARDMGVLESSMCGTPALGEEMNIGSVVQRIYALGGAVQVNVPEFMGPSQEAALKAAGGVGAPKFSMCGMPDLYEETNRATGDAFPEYDGPNPGNEVKAETHGDKDGQSAGLSGTTEVEEQTAGQSCRKTGSTSKSLSCFCRCRCRPGGFHEVGRHLRLSMR